MSAMSTTLKKEIVVMNFYKWDWYVCCNIIYDLE